MLNSCCGSADQLCKTFSNNVSEIAPHSASREIEGGNPEGGIVKRGLALAASMYVRPFFPCSVSLIVVDDAMRLGAGDLKYGHVDAKNIGARYIRFIRCIAEPDAHTSYRARECGRTCAPSGQ